GTRRIGAEELVDDADRARGHGAAEDSDRPEAQRTGRGAVPHCRPHPRRKEDGVLRAAVLALTVATGFSARAGAGAWQRVLASLLGSHGGATAAGLALCLGGLALDDAAFGRLVRRLVHAGAARGRPPRLLLLYGGVEAAIGLHALVFPALFGALRALSAALPHAPGGLGFALDVGLAALLVLPPCFLMGATIPILTQALARGLADA